MVRKHSRSKRTHRRRGHRGGGWGFTGPSSIPGTPGTVSNPQVFTGIGDCRAAEPGYTIPVSNYAASLKGLPGMSGGKRTRRSRRGKTRKQRKQRGGRYGFFPEGDPNPSGQLYYAGSYAPVQRIACEGTSPNPLNPTHTGSSAPPGAASPNYWMKGGAQMAPATYGVGNVDSMYYYAPTAGYANTASTWKDSVGAPVQIQVPFAAREMNQACLTTGGHPPLTGALQKGGKGTRKFRGGGILNNLKAKAPKFLSFQAIRNTITGTTGANNAVAAVEGVVVEETPLEGSNVPAPAPAPTPAAPVTSAVGGKHKRRHAKKKTHKRKH